jgi:ELWxxDGT repeat protein
LAAQSPYLIRDINENGAPSNPRGLVTIGSITYFYADDGIYGRELWRSDGTEDGTYLVKDINPGKGHGFFNDTFDEYTVLIPVGEMGGASKSMMA